MSSGRLVNPWTKLRPEPWFVLDEDRIYVDAFNALLDQDEDRAKSKASSDGSDWKSRESLRLKTDLPPVPFAGFHNAPVVVLAANPSWSDKSLIEDVNHPGIDIIMGGIQTPGGTSFWPLLDSPATSSALEWWGPRTRELRDAVGDDELVVNGLLVVELHGYRSQSWVAPWINFPSQAFSFQLVRDAIEREAIIVIVKCRRYWLGSVPELRTHPRLHIVEGLASTRNAALSSKNLRPENFDLLVRQFQHKNAWQR